ncbi:hypothetical protein GA0070610_1270 [Micromonospora echinofusca]|uniref:Uncharacterized protein n=1 Tax=Micromonospora echinofusca TaxID=47858 RepID=A0A1C5G658_MICEH|nr:hypothetical protein [Micromonospora echinofusca]SCG15042.1 hypothetical protein GA0070610_1270 [Micromonospora echinofusca]
MSAGPLRAGDVVLLTREASPQFTRPLTVRVIRELTDRHPYAGWFWFEGYELNRRGAAVQQRELYALRAGVRWLSRAIREVPAGRRTPVPPVPARAGTR